MPKSPKEMGEAIARNLPEKTGRTFEQWVELARDQGPPARKERVAWLKSAHGLGTVTANFIAADAEGRSIVATYADEGALLDAMYGGDRAHLRPLYDRLAKTARAMGKDVELTVCKTYVGVRRARQFAMIKPSTFTRIDLGLALPGSKPAGRLLKAGSIGNDRMTHRIEIASKAGIDGEVRQWLKAAYERAV
jgi:predicted transport protein